MAFTINRYRVSNPGTSSRGFDMTAADGDTTLLTYSFFPRPPWTPDSWSFSSTDGTACQTVGQWRGMLSDSGPLPEQRNDTFTVFKTAGGGSGGAVRLTLYHLAVRP